MKVEHHNYIIYAGYAIIILLLIASFILNIFEVFPFNVYKRGFAPTEISTGDNKSPYTEK